MVDAWWKPFAVAACCRVLVVVSGSVAVAVAVNEPVREDKKGLGWYLRSCRTSANLVLSRPKTRKRRRRTAECAGCKGPTGWRQPIISSALLDGFCPAATGDVRLILHSQAVSRLKDESLQVRVGGRRFATQWLALLYPSFPFQPRCGE